MTTFFIITYSLILYLLAFLILHYYYNEDKSTTDTFNKYTMIFISIFLIVIGSLFIYKAIF